MSDKANTNRKWTSNNNYRKNFDAIFRDPIQDFKDSQAEVENAAEVEDGTLRSSE
jgi:hypothetical protein